MDRFLQGLSFLAQPTALEVGCLSILRMRVLIMSDIDLAFFLMTPMDCIGLATPFCLDHLGIRARMKRLGQGMHCRLPVAMEGE